MTTVRLQATYDAVSNGATKTANGETLKVGLDGSTIYRGAARFAAAATLVNITRVELEVSVRKAGESTGRWDIRPYHTNGTGDPEADSAANLYSRAVSQTPYVDDSFLFRHTGRHRILLGAGKGATACTDLAIAAAAGGHIFSLGFGEQGDDDDYCELEALDYADSDNPPELIVTYGETVSLLAVLKALAKRIDNNHYQTGTLTTSSATVPADSGLKDEDHFWTDFWLLLGAGTYIGASRKILTFANTGGVMTVAKAFGGASGAVAYYLMATSPLVMVEALNAALVELFPRYAGLAVAHEVGVMAHRYQEYDLPAGMDSVDSVEWRQEGDDRTWNKAAFRRLDASRIRVTDEYMPESGIVIRIAGKQRLSQYTEGDPLTLTEVSEFTVPDAGEWPLSELILTTAEWNLEKWLFDKYEPSIALGQGAAPAPVGYAPSNQRMKFLAATLAELKGAFLDTEPGHVSNPWI